MDFAICYNGITIENFTTTTVHMAKKYLRARYINSGKGCSLVYFEKNGKKVTLFF